MSGLIRWITLQLTCHYRKFISILNSLYTVLLLLKNKPVGTEKTAFNAYDLLLLIISLLSCCCPSVCFPSVTFVHPTQPVEIFGNVSMPFGAIRWHPRKILRRSFQGNPSVRGVKRKRVAKYRDFGPIEGNISKTVQDRRYVSINH